VPDRDQVVEHLKFFGELGAEGISRDPRWRTRPCEQGTGGTRHGVASDAAEIGGAFADSQATAASDPEQARAGSPTRAARPAADPPVPNPLRSPGIRIFSALCVFNIMENC